MIEDWNGGALAFEFDTTIKALKAHGYEAALVRDVVAFPVKPTECEGINARRVYLRKIESKCEVPTSYRLGQKSIYDDGMKSLAEHHNIPYVVADDALCDDDKCSMFDESSDLLYIDPNHLNMKASLKVGSALIEALENKGFF